jgi:hypothetical protein
MGEMSFFMTGCTSVTILTSPRDAVNRTADRVTFVSCVNFVAVENFSVLEPGTCKTINKQNGTPYRGKRFLTRQIPTSCLSKSGGIISEH